MREIKSKEEFEVFFEDLLIKNFKEKYEDLWDDFVVNRWDNYQLNKIFYGE